MSYRSEALAASDEMSDDEWSWFSSNRRKRQEFRDLIADGRVDPRLVLHNIGVAQRITAAHCLAMDMLREFSEIPVLRKGTGVTPKLQAVIS